MMSLPHDLKDLNLWGNSGSAREQRPDPRSLVGGLEVAGVEVLVEVGAPLVGEAVEAAVYLGKKSVLHKLAAAGAGVLPDWTAFGFDGGRRKVAVVPDEFQDHVVARDHPVGALAHLVGRCLCSTHILTGSYWFVTVVHQCTDSRPLALYNRQLTLW